MITFAPLIEHLHITKMSKTQFAEKVGLSPPTQAKIFKDEPVQWDVLDRICNALEIPIERVIRHIPDKKDSMKKEESIE